MKIVIAAGLLGMAHAAALPTSSATGREGFAAITPVAAANTNRTIEDLGITPAVLTVPVKPNPNFTPNITAAMAAAQAKYVIVEERLQAEKRELYDQQFEKRADRAGFGALAPAATTTTSAAGRAGFGNLAVSTTTTTTKAAVANVNLPCAYFPAFCKTTSTTTSSKPTTTSKVTTTTSSIKTTSSTSLKPTFTSTTVKSTSTTSSTMKSISTTSSTIKSTSTTSSKLTTSTSSMKPSTSSTSTTSSSSILPQITVPSTTSTKPATTSSTSTTSTTSSKPTTSSTSSKTTTSTTSSLKLLTSTTSSIAAVATLAAVDIQLDSEYLSEITIGSNANKVNVVMDTGSADLWMFSTDCVGCSSSHNFYNPSKSTTFVNTTTQFSLTYGDGSKTSGYLGFDTVNLAGVPIQAQSIDVPHTISSSLQSNSMDGILGLGFPSLMATQGVAGVTTPITDMVKQNLIPTGKFGLQYIKDDHWSYSGGGGAWTFGGYDSSVVSGSINSIALSHAQYWMVPLQQVSVGSAYSYTPSQQIIVDSGTTLILLDSASVAHIHSYLPGGRVSPDGSHYQIFCNASSSTYTGTRNVYFTLGGQKYGVPAADLAWYPETSEYCYSGIQAWSNSFGILGVMFLKNVYAVFDQTNTALGLGVRTDVAALTD